MFNERRQMRRFQPQPGHDWAVVSLDGVDTPVLLVDESAGGFAISSSPTLCLQVGKEFQLRVHSGAYEVETAHVERKPNETQYGLRMLKVLVEGDRELSAKGRKYTRAESTRLLGKILSAACAVVLVAGLYYTSPWAALSLRGDRTSGASVGALTAETNGRRPPGIEMVNSLASPEFAKVLQLNRDQQQLRDRIFDEAAGELSALNARSHSQAVDQWAADSSKIVERAIDRYLRMLNRRQIEQLVSKLPASATGNSP
jgi:hypothetical protein